MYVGKRRWLNVTIGREWPQILQHLSSVSKAEQDAKKTSELHPVQALSNMLSVTFFLVTNSSVDEQPMVWINPFSTGETLVDSPVLILGCEMEFHFHSCHKFNLPICILMNKVSSHQTKPSNVMLAPIPSMR